MKSEVDGVDWFEDKKKPSVETEVSIVDGKVRKKFVYNKEKFPNLREQHAEKCNCEYCNPSSPLPSASPIKMTTEEMIVMQIDKTWDLRPKTNELDEEIDYVELKEPTEAEIEGIKSECTCTCSEKSVGTKKCAPPFGADPIPMADSIVCWANAELDMIYKESLAEQERLEDFIHVESTIDYQEKQNLKGLAVCYVYVGNAINSDWAIAEQKAEWEPILVNISEDWEKIFLPVRDGSSRIEMVRF